MSINRVASSLIFEGLPASTTVVETRSEILTPPSSGTTASSLEGKGFFFFKKWNRNWDIETRNDGSLRLTVVVQKQRSYTCEHTNYAARAVLSKNDDSEYDTPVKMDHHLVFQY